MNTIRPEEGEAVPPREATGNFSNGEGFIYMADYILALDQGTTSSRAIVFDRAGQPIPGTTAFVLALRVEVPDHRQRRPRRDRRPRRQKKDERLDIPPPQDMGSAAGERVDTARVDPRR